MAWALLLLAIPVCTGTALAGESSVSQPPAAAAGALEEFQPKELEGSDSKVAALAAHRLLQAIAKADSSVDSTRRVYLEYFFDKLSGAKLGKPDGDVVAAERIVDALATWITSSGPPIPQTTVVLEPLVGVGPRELRGAVVRAFQALVRHELKVQPSSSPTLLILAGHFSESPPPTEACLRDCAEILWKTDGKTLLSTLLASLAATSGASPETPQFTVGTVALEELRLRIPLDFPSVEGWQKWWQQNKGSSLEAVLSACEASTRQEYVSSWKQLIRRLRETTDAEKLLLAIQDTIQSVYGPELRVAATTATGDFAEWILEIPMADAKASDSTGKPDSRDKLLAQGVQMLLPMLAGGGVYVERPEVVRAAMVSLGKYHSFLERSPVLLQDVSTLVLARLSELAGADHGRKRAEFLEALRLAGTLRVTGARVFAEAFLREAEQRPSGDLELLTAAVTALGRILEKRGLTPQTADLLIRFYKKPPQSAEKAVREFQRVCVAALAGEVESSDVREKLNGLYREILTGGSGKDLRISAILGLGALARRQDAEALGLLKDVLARQERFEPQEVVAAVDSLAYVGRETALPAFLRLQSLVKDRTVQDHLLKKTAGLAAETGASGLVSVLESLLRLSFEGEVPGALEFAVALCAEPQARDLLAVGKQGTGADGSLEAAWNVLLLLARVEDLLGKGDAVDAVLTQLADLLQKDPSIKDRHAQAVADLAMLKASVAQREAIAARIAKASAGDVAPLEKDLEGLMSTASPVWIRWIHLRWVYRLISQGPGQPVLERLRDLWCEAAASGRSQGWWKEFPDGFRQRYLGLLDSLKAAPRSASEPQAPSQ